MLIINLIKLNTPMEEETKCPTCGHEHTKEDGTCNCGCGDK
ncbi:MAG TPA: hypothetical protein VIK86_08945 [Candidatus Paceibacterota bacterium]